MNRRRFGKAIGTRGARKLIRDIGGAIALDLIAERERTSGPLHNDQIIRLKDGRVLQISYGSAHLYPSTQEYRQLLASIEERSRRPTEQSLSASAARPQPIAPATGALGAVPDTAYRVIKRYGDGRPWGVSFTRDLETESFPFAGGTEAWFKRTGEIIGGVLSRPCSFGQLEFPARSFVRFYSGHKDGRVSDVKLGADQDVQGVPCQAGTNVFFNFHKRQPYLSAATLASDHEIDGILYPAGTWFALDRHHHLTDSRPPGWDR